MIHFVDKFPIQLTDKEELKYDFVRQSAHKPESHSFYGSQFLYDMYRFGLRTQNAWQRSRFEMQWGSHPTIAINTDSYITNPK